MLKKNIVNLFINQIFSYVAPLLLLPFLSRTLDVTHFGLYIFSLSTISIATVITNYGFDISVAKRIAEGENKKENLNEFLYQVNIIKSFICFFTIIIVAYILYTTNYFTDNPINIYIILLSIVFSSYNLIWLFQGLEKIYIYSRITIVTRLLSMLLIIITIKSSSDFSLLLLLNFLQILVSIITSYYIIFNWNLKFKTCSIKKTIFLFKDSTEYFISRVGVTLYSSACSFFLGIFSGSLHQVAIYGTAEQLYRAGVYLMSAISSPLTPYMARTKNYSIFWKIVVFTLIITILGASIGFVFGDDIIRLIYGSKFNDSYSILNVFMLTIIISVMGMFFGYPALIPIGKTKIANYSVLYAGFLQLIILLIMYMLHIEFTAIKIAFSYFLCELFVLIIRLIYFLPNYKIMKNEKH